MVWKIKIHFCHKTPTYTSYTPSVYMRDFVDSLKSGEHLKAQLHCSYDKNVWVAMSRIWRSCHLFLSSQTKVRVYKVPENAKLLIELSECLYEPSASLSVLLMLPLFLTGRQWGGKEGEQMQKHPWNLNKKDKELMSRGHIIWGKTESKKSGPEKNKHSILTNLFISSRAGSDSCVICVIHIRSFTRAWGDEALNLTTMITLLWIYWSPFKVWGSKELH